MMKRYSYLLLLIPLSLVLASCGLLDNPPTPGVDQAMVATAVAATMAAQAILTQAAALTPSPSPTPITAIGETLPPPTPTEMALLATATETVAASPLCRVVSPELNVRTGPGLVYEPPLLNLPQNAELIPIGYNPTGFPGQWLQVQIANTNQIGWVSADLQFVNCNLANFNSLPFIPGPPPPTPIPTNTPLPAQPTPTPTPEYLVLVPGSGGNSRVRGQVLFPGYGSGFLDPDNVVIRDWLAFRVQTFYADSGSTQDGAGIDFVEISIFEYGQEGRQQVHYQKEEDPPYCLFGGHDLECRPWLVFAERGYHWPNGAPIQNTSYEVEINIQPEHGDSAANWNFDFRIEGVPPSTQPQNLQAELVQTAPGTNDSFVQGALVFQVIAYDPSVGNWDGAGIHEVEMRLLWNGHGIYGNTEQNAAYCLFEGGEPNCEVWFFADHNFQWPHGEFIEPGGYTLQAVIKATNGQHRTIEWPIQINP